VTTGTPTANPAPRTQERGGLGGRNAPAQTPFHCFSPFSPRGKGPGGWALHLEPLAPVLSGTLNTRLPPLVAPSSFAWPREGAQPLGAARDPLVTLSGSCGQLSAWRQVSEESLLAMAARSEWFGATAGKDSSLELAPQCCLAVTAAQNDSRRDGGQPIHRRFWDTPCAYFPLDRTSRLWYPTSD